MMDALLILGGVALLYGGGELLVRYASGLGRALGMSPLVVGLTIVSFGTSAPELASTLSATLKGSPDIAIGNVIGSSIFNLLDIAGVTALVSPIDVGAQFIETDIGILLAASAGVVVLALALGRLGRRAGLLLLTAYAAYILQLG